MRVMWITNVLSSEANQYFYGENHGGLWVELFLNSIRNFDGIDLCIVTSNDTKTVRSCRFDNVSYYVIPGGHPIKEFSLRSAKNKKNLSSVIEAYQPDIIQIWGTESSLGRLAQKIAPQIKTVVFIQGLVQSLRKYCLAGLSHKDLMSSLTVRGLLKGDLLCFKRLKYKKSEKIEKEVLQNAQLFVYENAWCYSVCKSIAPETNGFKQILPVDDAFREGKWDYNDSKRIICPFMYDTFKGLLLLLKALTIVVKSIPDVKLVLPGIYRKPAGSVVEWLKTDDYSRMIQSYIQKNGLSGNIEYVGRLSPKEFVEEMKRANLFVMCSTIENHSSTLKEAMMLGMPCITSDVGGVGEYAKHKYNTLVYRCEDHELLAHYILTLLNDRQLSVTLGEHARTDMTAYMSECRSGEELYDLYKEMLGGKSDIGSLEHS